MEKLDLEKINFDKYLFRCHRLGDLMTKPRLKSETLSQTTITYLKEIHKEALFDRNEKINNKYLDKGIEAEEQSITLLSEYKDQLFVKNANRFSNHYLTGEPDSIKNGLIDIKTSWDYKTFPFYDQEMKNKNYYWQLQGYMALTGLKKAELIYCLVDTPERLIQDEIRRKSWQLGFIEVPEELEDEIYRNLTYSDLPKEIRVKIFEIERNDEDIKALYEKIDLCRIELNNMTKQVKELFNKQTKQLKK